MSDTGNGANVIRLPARLRLVPPRPSKAGDLVIITDGVWAGERGYVWDFIIMPDGGALVDVRSNGHVIRDVPIRFVELDTRGLP